MGKTKFEIGANGEQPFAIRIIDFATDMASPRYLTMPRSTRSQFYPMKAITIMQNGAMATSFVQKWFLSQPHKSTPTLGKYSRGCRTRVNNWRTLSDVPAERRTIEKTGRVLFKTTLPDNHAERTYNRLLENPSPY